MTDALYEDGNVRVKKTGVHIKWYYFPTATERTVVADSVKAVFHFPTGTNFWRIKSWGQAFSPAFWACDMRRHFDTGKHNVVLRTDETHDKGFTVDRLDDFLAALKPMLNQGVTIDDKY